MSQEHSEPRPVGEIMDEVVELDESGQPHIKFDEDRIEARRLQAREDYLKDETQELEDLHKEMVSTTQAGEGSEEITERTPEVREDAINARADSIEAQKQREQHLPDNPE